MQALEGRCFVTDTRAPAGSAHGTLRVRPLIGRHNGAVNISMRLLEFGPGGSPWLYAHTWDDVWYVLEGRGDLVWNDRRSALGADTGIHLGPGDRARIDNTSGETLRVVSVRCPDPGTESHVGNTGERETRATSAAAPHVRARQPLVHLMDCEAEETADRWFRVLIDPQRGCDQVTQFVGSIPPGRAPDHFHEYEEVLYILRGHGRMWAGETHTEIDVGSCVYLPRQQIHCVENRGADALRLLGVFYPAGSPADRRDDAVRG